MATNSDIRFAVERVSAAGIAALVVAASTTAALAELRSTQPVAPAQARTPAPAESRSRQTVAPPPSRKPAPAPTGVRIVDIDYRAHDGSVRGARVLVPASYGTIDRAAIPLVISPHGRGLDGAKNTALWGDLPGIGGFALVSPDGQGRELSAHSWGAPGQIEDLARMPSIVGEALPWLQIDRTRIYAVGGSMGGQESLLLLGRYPSLLAGAAVFDSVTDFPLQYRNYPRLRCLGACKQAWGDIGRALQSLARREIGGSPATEPVAYAARSPLLFAPAIAASCVPLQIWWSTEDRIVVDSSLQSGRMLARIKHANPHARVEGYVGKWRHTVALRSTTQLPVALARLGLLPRQYNLKPRRIRHIAASPLATNRCSA